jgi:hypothetical protein
MTKSNAKTDNTKEVAKASGSYTGPAIYLTLNGNDWQTNSVYLTTAIYQAHENKSPLYVTSNSGGSSKPPNCPPGFPNC